MCSLLYSALLLFGINRISGFYLVLQNLYARIFHKRITFLGRTGATGLLIQGNGTCPHVWDYPHLSEAVFLRQETAIYDCCIIKENAESSDEDSMPSTPKMTTAEQIERLYHRLQCMWEESEKHPMENEIDERGRLSGGRTNLAKVPLHEAYSYWNDNDDPRLEQYLSSDEMQVSDLRSKHSGERKADTMPPSTCWIGGMPSEILVFVLELVASAYKEVPDDAAEFGGRNGWRIPITLGHVCCSWRTLVLETPSLWRSFSLVLDRTPRFTEGLKASLQLWLQNSRSTEVAINLEVDPACANILDQELMNQLERMLRRCWRLRTNVSHEMFCRILQLPLLHLRRLEVWSSWLLKDIGGFSVQAPSLQSLVLLGPNMVNFEKNTLPWSQIQESKGTCWADMQQHSRRHRDTIEPGVVHAISPLQSKRKLNSDTANAAATSACIVASWD